MHRILDSYEKGEDWKDLLPTLGVKYATARNWIRIYDSTGRLDKLPCTTHRAKCLSEDQIKDIIKWVEASNAIRLKEIKERISLEFGLQTSLTTIHRYLKKKLYTRKKLHHEPVTMNNQDNKEKRWDFVLKLNEYINEDRLQLIFNTIG